MPEENRWSPEDEELIRNAFFEQEGFDFEQANRMKGGLQQAYDLIPPEDRRPLLRQIKAAFVELAFKSWGDLDDEDTDEPIKPPWRVQVARETRLAKVLKNYPQFKKALFAVVPLQDYHYRASVLESNGWPIHRLTRENFRGLPYLYWSHVAMPVLEPTEVSNP